MYEQLKDRLLLICVTITVITLILSISSGIGSQRNKAKFQKEMLQRLDMEEKLENSKFVVSALEEEIKKLQTQANTEKDARQKIAQELEEEKLVTNALKEELVKITRLKEVLENNLKEALAGKSSKR